MTITASAPTAATSSNIMRVRRRRNRPTVFQRLVLALRSRSDLNAALALARVVWASWRVPDGAFAMCPTPDVALETSHLLALVSCSGVGADANAETDADVDADTEDTPTNRVSPRSISCNVSFVNDTKNNYTEKPQRFYLTTLFQLSSFKRNSLMTFQLASHHVIRDWIYQESYSSL